MKIYAKQVNPEHQESPIFMDYEWPDDIAVYGNDKFNSHLPEDVSDVLQVLEAGMLADALDDIERGKGWGHDCYDGSVRSAIEDFLPISRDCTDAEIEALEDIIACCCTERDKGEALARALEIVSGREWKFGTIHGSAQGDWQNVCYIAGDWSEEAIRRFESEYFNAGSEWEIHNGKEAPYSPEDVDGYYTYCTAWSDAGIKAEIAGVAGCKPEEVVLYKWKGVKTIDIYEVV